mgnify:CR=1 FL=1|jgi:putative transcriptional regulator
MPKNKRYTSPDEIDFTRLDAMTEAEVQAAAETDPDNLPMTAADFAKLTRVYTPDQIRALRGRFKMSRPVFAARFHIPVRQLQEWEQGRKKPSAAANTLFRVIDREPEAVERALASG